MYVKMFAGLYIFILTWITPSSSPPMIKTLLLLASIGHSCHDSIFLYSPHYN